VLNNITVPNLAVVNGLMTIDTNGFLTSLNGFSQLSQVNGISILNNNALTQVTGFTSLSIINGDLQINGNGALTDISGLTTLTSVLGGINYSGNSGTTLNGLTKIAGTLKYLDLEDNPNLINLDILCKINTITTYLRVKRNPSLNNLNGLYTVTAADVIDIGDNIGLDSYNGLTSLTQSSSISVYGSLAKCGAFSDHLIQAQLDYGTNRIECCGNGILDPMETCEPGSDGTCSGRCILCTPSMVANDCNCNQRPCSNLPFGICPQNGSCIYNQNIVQTSMCGNPIPGYISYTTSTGVITSTSSQSSTTSNVVTTDCTVQGKILACNLVVSDLDLRSVSEITVLSNLTISGAVIKFNATTKVHILGCLIVKNNSKISLTKSIFQNHMTVKLFDYVCIDGSFVDTIFSDVDTSVKECYQEDKITYASDSLSMTFKNPCDDQAQVTKSIMALGVILVATFVGGGVVYYFVRNRKRQIKKAQGLGAKSWRDG